MGSPDKIDMSSVSGELDIPYLIDIISKYPVPWHVVKAEYADGYVGHDIVDADMQDILEKVPYALAVTIVRLVNGSPITIQIAKMNK